MPDIYFAQDTFDIRDLIGNDRDTFDRFCRMNSARNFRVVHRGSPYCLDAQGPTEESVVQQIGGLPDHRRARLGIAARDFGDDVHTVSEFVDRNLTWIEGTPMSLAGAGTTALDSRLTDFQKALQHYQEALLRLHGFTNNASNGSAGSARHRSHLEAQVREAYQDLDQRFRAEMDRIVPRANRQKNRGNALSNAQRGIGLAGRGGAGRPDPRLFVADNLEAKRLERLASFTRYAGHGLLLLDAGFRVNEVVDDYYDDDEDWRRTAAEEATAFGLAGSVGGVAGKGTVTGLAAGAVALGFTVTPAGWALILAGGVAAGAGSGYIADQWGRGLIEAIWSWSEE